MSQRHQPEIQSTTPARALRNAGSGEFTLQDPIASFEAVDGEDNAEDESILSSMKFAFETTPTGSRMTVVTRFSSLEAMEQTVPVTRPTVGDGARQV